MFDKLMQAQQKAEEIKKRLDGIIVSAEVEAGKIKVTATANKSIESITIEPGFLKSADQEEIEELLIIAVNKALQQAETVSQQEMQSSARDMMGDLGSLFGQ